MNKNPLVMCLTNVVAADFTANALLAIGAKPAMVEEPSEAAELASKADAVLINLGTVHPRQADAMRSAISKLVNLPTCKLANLQTSSGSSPVNQLNSCQVDKSGMGTVPWVLDPVACHLLTYRGKLAAEFIAKKPTLIRGNHAEIDFLCGNLPEMRMIPILSTGEVDRIYPGTDPQSLTANSQQLTTIPGGVPMLQMVTATGCAQGAICAAMLGRGLSPVDAAESASRLMKRAGELAWSRAKQPGSFKVALIDALYELSHD